MRRRLIPLLMASVLAGCASAPPTIDQGRSHKVDWIGAWPTLEGSYVSMTFDFDGRVYGTGGCNHWFAGYGVEGEILRFSRIGSTKRACDTDLMKQEQQFFETLGQIRRWDLSPNGELRLWPEQGKPIRLHAE